LGGGAISTNSNDPGDALAGAATISAAFDLTEGQMFDPRTIIEIVLRVKFCWYSTFWSQVTRTS
jgi:hypothetical protein